MLLKRLAVLFLALFFQVLAQRKASECTNSCNDLRTEVLSLSICK